jgi:Ca2+-transporting ATPase
MSVVMAGDGFNDVLALKVADVGIAMGLEGAELARRTADLVLENDDLSNLPRAIAIGRSFYGNIRRSLLFVMATSHMDVLAELFTRSGFGGRGPSLLQSVWNNLACLALALESADADGTEPPPPADAFLTPQDVKGSQTDALKVVTASGAAAAYGWWSRGAGPGSDRLLWRSLSINQMLYALSCRNGNGSSPPRPNRRLQALFGAVVGGQLLATLGSGGAGRALADLLALGVSAGLSRLLVAPRTSAPALPEEQAPTADVFPSR